MERRESGESGESRKSKESGKERRTDWGVVRMERAWRGEGLSGVRGKENRGENLTEAEFLSIEQDDAA